MAIFCHYALLKAAVCRQLKPLRHKDHLLLSFHMSAALTAEQIHPVIIWIPNIHLLRIEFRQSQVLFDGSEPTVQAIASAATLVPA